MSVAGLPLILEGQDEDRLLVRLIAMESRIDSFAKPDHQLAKLGLRIKRTAGP